MPTGSAPTPASHGPPDFSLMLGGPLYQLWRRARLSGAALEFPHRRIIALAALAWVPLLVLSVVERKAWGGVTLPFLKDGELHVRLLVALPLLIGAERFVHRRLRPIAQQFLVRDLIPDSSLPAFDSAVVSAMRLRNSAGAEASLLVLVYVVGVGFLWRTRIALDVPSWHGTPAEGVWHPSLAGWWLGLVSLPLFQFLFLRWYFRLFVWARFLWQVSRIELRLMPAHPDRSGGLGFMGFVGYAFAPLLLAQGAALAGMMANRLLYAGASLPDFKVELIGLVAVLLFALLGPLLVFSQQLAAAKRAGLREHGALAQRYVREYDHKWLRGGAPRDEPLVGSADIQSLADLGNSFEVVRGMRWVPFTPLIVLQMAGTALLPILPLTLIAVPLDKLVDRLLEVAF